MSEGDGEMAFFFAEADQARALEAHTNGTAIFKEFLGTDDGPYVLCCHGKAQRDAPLTIGFAGDREAIMGLWQVARAGDALQYPLLGELYIKVLDQQPAMLRLYNASPALRNGTASRVALLNEIGEVLRDTADQPTMLSAANARTSAVAQGPTDPNYAPDMLLRREFYKWAGGLYGSLYQPGQLAPPKDLAPQLLTFSDCAANWANVLIANMVIVNRVPSVSVDSTCLPSALVDAMAADINPPAYVLHSTCVNSCAVRWGVDVLTVRVFFVYRILTYLADLNREMYRLHQIDVEIPPLVDDDHVDGFDQMGELHEKLLYGEGFTKLFNTVGQTCLDSDRCAAVAWQLQRFGGNLLQTIQLALDNKAVNLPFFINHDLIGLLRGVLGEAEAEVRLGPAFALGPMMDLLARALRRGKDVHVEAIAQLVHALHVKRDAMWKHPVFADFVRFCVNSTDRQAFVGLIQGQNGTPMIELPKIDRRLLCRLVDAQLTLLVNVVKPLLNDCKMALMSRTGGAQRLGRAIKICVDLFEHVVTALDFRNFEPAVPVDKAAEIAKLVAPELVAAIVEIRDVNAWQDPTDTQYERDRTIYKACVHAHDQIADVKNADAVHGRLDNAYDSLGDWQYPESEDDE